MSTTSDLLNPRLRAQLRLFSQLASMFVVLMASLVLLGWGFDIGALKSVRPGWVTMKSNSALAFLLSGLSLWLLVNDRAGQPKLTLTRISAGIVALIGLLTLSEHFTERDFGIDQLLFTESSVGLVSTSHPGRMAPATAAGFLMLGLAILLLDTRHGRQLAQWLTLTMGLMSVIALVGYLYDVAALYAIGRYTAMALHTSLTFVVLSAGVLCARPDRGFMTIATNGTIGGIVARRLLPAAVGIPLLLGWLTLVGQRAGLYEAGFGVALFATANFVVFLILIGSTTNWLSQVDAERKRAEDAVQKHSQELEERVYKRTLELTESNNVLKAEVAERKLAEEERERLIVELQDALGKIKVLQGILPICSHCKMIRDDQNQWHAVESYVKARSDADFSHGICPTCLDKYYPGLDSGRR